MVVEVFEYPDYVSSKEFEILLKQSCGFYRCGLCLHKPILLEDDDNIVLRHHEEEYDSILWPIRITLSGPFINIEYPKYNWFLASIEGVQKISLKYSLNERCVIIKDKKYYCKKSHNLARVCLESTQSKISQVELSYNDGNLDNINYSIDKQHFGGRLYNMSPKEYNSLKFIQN